MSSKNQKRRNEAFRNPLPRGWLPRVGERVWVSPKIGEAVSFAIVTAVALPAITVRCHRGPVVGGGEFDLSLFRPVRRFIRQPVGRISKVKTGRTLAR
jgi:hypothetical protein